MQRESPLTNSRWSIVPAERPVEVAERRVDSWIREAQDGEVAGDTHVTAMAARQRLDRDVVRLRVLVQAFELCRHDLAIADMEPGRRLSGARSVLG